MTTQLELGHQARDSALAAAIAKHGPVYEKLVLLARTRALLEGSTGITVADLREGAALSPDPEVRAAIPLKGAGRELSWLGGVLKAAGLKPTDRIRRSHIPGTHGNRNVVFLHPMFAERP